MNLDDVMPLGEAECCRVWLVPIGYGPGRCGLCEERPKFLRILPEEQWLPTKGYRNA